MTQSRNLEAHKEKKRRESRMREIFDNILMLKAKIKLAELKRRARFYLFMQNFSSSGNICEKLKFYYERKSGGLKWRIEVEVRKEIWRGRNGKINLRLHLTGKFHFNLAKFSAILTCRLSFNIQLRLFIN